MSRLATKTGLLVALLAILVLVGGCGPASDADPGKNAVETPMSEKVLTAEDEGSRVELRVGQALVVRLESNPTTGYGWEVAGSTEPALRQVGETEFEPQSDLLGAPGVEILRFFRRRRRKV